MLSSRRSRSWLRTTAHDHDRSYWEDRTLAPLAFLLYLGVDADLLS